MLSPGYGEISDLAKMDPCQHLISSAHYLQDVLTVAGRGWLGDGVIRV